MAVALVLTLHLIGYMKRAAAAAAETAAHGLQILHSLQPQPSLWGDWVEKWYNVARKSRDFVTAIQLA